MARRADTRIGHLGQTSNSSDGSRTITIHDVPTSEQGGPSTNGMEDGESSHHAGVLRLRGGGNTRRVVWTEETVDNEGMGKKKSKICCIYHKPKAFDQSSDESSSSVSDSEGSLSDMSETSASSHASADTSVNASQAMRDKASQANEQRKGKQKKKSSDCNGEHHHSSGHGRRLKRQAGGSNTIVEKESTEDKSIAYPVPNAYERGVS